MEKGYSDVNLLANLGTFDKHVANLASINQRLVNNASSIEWILGQIKQNWENEAGTDLKSIIEGLEKCINTLNNTISPTITKYVSTMNVLSEDTKRNESEEYEGDKI